MTTVLHNISNPEGLTPKAKYFAEVGDTCINVDGCIELFRKVDTPQAKAMWRAFRKRFVHMRQQPSDLTPEKIREAAFFKALDDLGIKFTLIPMPGTMKP